MMGVGERPPADDDPHMLSERSGRVRAALYAGVMIAVGLSLGAFVPLPHGGEPGIGILIVVPACAYAPLFVTRAKDRIADLGIAIWLGTTSLWLGWLLRLAFARAGEGGPYDFVVSLIVVGLLLYLFAFMFATPLIAGGVLAAWWVQGSLPLLASGVGWPSRLRGSTMILLGVLFEAGALLLELRILRPYIPW